MDSFKDLLDSGYVLKATLSLGEALQYIIPGKSIKCNR